MPEPEVPPNCPPHLRDKWIAQSRDLVWAKWFVALLAVAFLMARGCSFAIGKIGDGQNRIERQTETRLTRSAAILFPGRRTVTSCVYHWNWSDPCHCAMVVDGDGLYNVFCDARGVTCSVVKTLSP